LPSLSLSLSLSSCHFSLAFFFALLPGISAKWSVNELRTLISDARASLPLSFRVFLADFGEEFRPPRFGFSRGCCWFVVAFPYTRCFPFIRRHPRPPSSELSILLIFLIRL
jgi:hypothetical protein